MGKADNKLKGAVYLGHGDTFLYHKSNSVGLKDLDDLCHFNISNRSHFKLTLARIKKGANLDVELYRIKSSFAEVRRKIGALDFRQIRRQDRKAHLQLVSTSKKSGNKNELLQVPLESGVYILRVLQRSGSSSYRMLAAGEPIISSPPPPNKLPTATFNGNSSVDSKSGHYDFTVTYRDDVAIDVSSLDDNDILVTSSNGFSQLAKRMAVNDGGDGTSQIVTYRINAPNGSWNSRENGSYNVSLQENQVSDTSGSFATAGSIGNFFVNIDQPPVPDPEAPQASLNAISPWKNGGEAYTFTVTYTDNFVVDVTSIDNGDVLVTNSQGFSQFAEKVSVDGNSAGISYTATYRVTAPKGNWGSAENGLYQITLQPNQVRDISSNFAAAGLLGSFSVEIPPMTQAPSDIFELGGAPNGSTTLFQIDFSKQDEDPRSNFGLFRGALLSGTVSGDDSDDGDVPWTYQNGDDRLKTFLASSLTTFNSINGGPKYRVGDLISFKNAEGKTEFRGILLSPDNYALCIGFTTSSSNDNLPNSLTLLKSSLSMAEATAVRFVGYGQDFQTGSKTLETISLERFIRPDFNLPMVSDRLMSSDEQNHTLEGLDPSGDPNIDPYNKVFGVIGNQLSNKITGNNSQNRLNGYGTTVSDVSQFDVLIGGGGSDTFVLGEGNSVYYVESGDGYAIIQDWEPGIDSLQTAFATGGQYTVEYKNVVGDPNKLDTEIYYSNGSIRDRIAILQDIKDVPPGMTLETSK